MSALASSKTCVIALDDSHVAHAQRVLSKLQYAKRNERADVATGVPDVTVHEGVATMTHASLFGASINSQLPKGAVSMRFTFRFGAAAARSGGRGDFSDADCEVDASEASDSEAAASDGDDDGDGGEAASDPETSSGGSGDELAEAKKTIKERTPLADARGVFQSRSVAEALIAAAGPQLKELNEALNSALVAKNAATKRRRVELHEMPAADDAPGVARRKLSNVAQQALGAVWTLARVSVGGRRAAKEAAMQAAAASLKGDPKALFALPQTKAVFESVIGSGLKHGLRACGACHTLGCRACRGAASPGAAEGSQPEDSAGDGEESQ
jgi:hypothetical protein